MPFYLVLGNKYADLEVSWWGFANAEDKARLEAFLSRSVRLGFRSASRPTLGIICAEADDRLFRRITCNTNYLLHALLPPPRDNQYELRDRNHNFILPSRSSSLLDCNFIMRMLFKNLNYSTYSQPEYYLISSLNNIAPYFILIFIQNIDQSFNLFIVSSFVYAFMYA